MTFRTADGASYEGKDDDGNDVFKVSIPLDEDGYLGRQCPSCRQMFRIQSEDYEALPEDTRLYCVYCGHEDAHSEFLTERQQQRLERVALDMGNQLIDNILGGALRNLARTTANNKFLTVTYRSTPFYPQPLPDIDEEKLVRERQCPTCELRYAVFGDHRYCPVSGPLDALAVALDALAAETAKLDALASIPEDQRGALREQGVFDRIYVDVLGNVVGIVETLAKATFNSRVAAPETYTKGKGNVFQRLDDTADLYATQLAVELRTASGVVWSELLRLWAVRHVHTHNDGRVDDRYLRAVPGAMLTVGQRVLVPIADARTAITQATALCTAMASATP
jgi:hypothetical protein